MEPITKGYSADQKYRVVKDGVEYLLRISPSERYEARKALFAMLKKVPALGIPMSEPVELGLCTEGVYTLYTWIDGEDAEDVIPLLPEREQYLLGIKAGEILKRIHSIPAPEDQEDWGCRFNRKTDVKIRKYNECPLRFEGDHHMIQYIEDHRELLKARPQCFQHGDYHIANMMMRSGELVVIDFDRFDFGDPWEEFNRIVWSAQASPSFASGQLDGYFGGRPPVRFFELLAFYIAVNALSSIPWAIPFGEREVDTMRKQARDVLRWYDDMQNPVPAWYRTYTQRVGGRGMNRLKCKKPSFAVIGKEGSTRDGEGFIQRLWEDANSHFAEVAHLAKKDAEGNIQGIWGLMSDFSRSFRPWEDGFSQGLYLAGVECQDEAQAPDGWTKWVVPAYEYLYVENEGRDTFPRMIAYLRENGITLAGAVHDFTCPQTGKGYMFFPVKRG